jgi:tetratricopeptide (TPR) repeat protein
VSSIALTWKADPPRGEWRSLLAIARVAGARSPDEPAIWTGLAQSALALGGEADAIGPVLDAVARMPAHAALRIAAGRLLFALDRFEEAQVEIDAALTLDPENRGARTLDFLLLVKLAKWREAAARVDAMRRIDRLMPQMLEVHWRTAENSGDLIDLLALCESILAERPGHANAAYFRAFLLARLGRDAEAREAMPTDRIVEIVDLSAPAGFADRDGFHAALRAEILANPTLTRNPRNKSTREGLRTRRLRQLDAPAVEALVSQIKAAVSAYVARRSAASEAFARSCPELARLDIWATVLGGDGFLMSHRHISGWLSGAYYVSAPRGDGYCGPLLFGALDAGRDGVEAPWDVIRVDPVPGRLVLFPSYAPHATEAAGIEGERISIGFDVIPC